MTSRKPKFKNNMAQAKSMQDLITRGQLGQSITLRWVIKNFSKRAWPSKPCLINFTKGSNQEPLDID